MQQSANQGNGALEEQIIWKRSSRADSPQLHWGLAVGAILLLSIGLVQWAQAQDLTVLYNFK